MSQDLLTIGQFARLAETTKRTVLWYEEKGLIKPASVNAETGYRFYSPSQIIDLKAIMLLRKLNFSLAQIKSRHGSLETLFGLKQQALEKEIASLQTMLKDTKNYYKNIKETKTLVNPKVKIIKPMKVFYIDKLGPYIKIGDYYEELRSNFRYIPKATRGLVIYEGHGGYQPKNAKVKVCLINCPGLKPKQAISKMVVPGFKALSYTHYGSTKLLSMLWKELEKYRDRNGYKADLSLPFEDLELSQSAHITEMLMPIK